MMQAENGNHRGVFVMLCSARCFDDRQYGVPVVNYPEVARQKDSGVLTLQHFYYPQSYSIRSSGVLRTDDV